LLQLVQNRFGSLFYQRKKDSIFEANMNLKQFAERDKLRFEGFRCAGSESADRQGKRFVVFDEFLYHVTCLQNMCGGEGEEGLFFCPEMLCEMLIEECNDMAGLEVGIVRPELQKCLFPLLQADRKQKRFMVVACERDNADVPFRHGLAGNKIPPLIILKKGGISN
jgi:hypothetical protein